MAAINGAQVQWAEGQSMQRRGKWQRRQHNGFLIPWLLLLASAYSPALWAAITVRLDSLGVFAYTCPKTEFQGVEKTILINTLDMSRYPELRLRLRVFREGYEIPVQREQVVIVQENIVYTPDYFAQQPDGWYEVRWYTREAGTRVVKLKDDCNPSRYVYVKAQVFVVDQEDVGIQTAYYRAQNIDYPRLRFLRGFSPIKEFFVGSGALGDTVRARVYFQAQSTFSDPKTGAELPLRIDSIQVSSPYFRVKWRGNFLAPSDTLFPVKAYPVFRYPIDIQFFPPSTEPQEAELWVYAERHLVAILKLFGNRIELEAASRLQLLEPTGGEKYAPCMEYPIRWEGANPQLPVFVEYRIADTARWKAIATVVDTNTIGWTVPDIPTDSLLIRVRQPALEASAAYLPADTAGIQEIQFSPDGKRFLTVYDIGCAGIWEVATWQQNGCIRLRDYDTAIDSARFHRKVRVDTGFVEYEVVEYYRPEEVRIITATFVPMGAAAVFRSKFTWPDTTAQRLVTKHSLFDTLAFFDLHSPFPTKVVSLPRGVSVQKMLYNPIAQELLLVAHNAATLLVYDSVGNFRRKVVLPASVREVELAANQQELYVLLLDRLQIRSSVDYQLRAERPLQGYPLMHRIAVDPMGRFFALAETPIEISLQHSPEMAVYLWDRQTLRLLRIQRQQWSEVQRLHFSATGRFLVIGVPGIPQVAVWDLTNDQLYTSYTGHPDRLTDVRFHPTAPVMVSASEGRMQNLKKRVFSYPEEDVVAQYLHIVAPQLRGITVLPPVDTLYLGDTVRWEQSAAMCNTGEVPIPLEQWWTRSQKFRPLQPPAPDTLFPGECVTLPFQYVARDTGTVRDTLFVATCSRTFSLPFIASVRDRSMMLDSQYTALGAGCVGEQLVRTIPIVVNRDPRPLKINGLQVYNPYQAPIQLVSTVQDTVLQPGDTLFVTFAFTPAKATAYKIRVFVYYADQGRIWKTVTVWGRGILPAAQFAVATLPFLPEIPQQTVSLMNASEEFLRFTAVDIAPPVYTLMTPLPIEVAPGDTVQLVVRATPGGTARLLLYGEPCDVRAQIQLVPYTARSVVWIPTVTIDPRDTVTVPVYYETRENAPYINERSFEGALQIAADRFLPVSLQSPYGTVEVLAHTVEDTLRRLRFRIVGRFDTAGTLLYIRGIPGLGLADRVPIRWVNMQSTLWGKAVDTRLLDGALVFRYPDATRRVYRPLMTVTAVYPHPASDWCSVRLRTEAAMMVICELRTLAGSVVRRWETILHPLQDDIVVNLSDCPPGTYWLSIVTSNQVLTVPILRLK